MKLKALSFRQPWANLIVEGRKSLDLRTWSTHYRGPLAVYASLEVEKEACALHGVDVKTLTTGALIGIVELVDVLSLDQATYQARAAEHLNGRPFRQGLYGWVLTNPRSLDPPQVVKGRLKLFEVQLAKSGEPLEVSSNQLSAFINQAVESRKYPSGVLPKVEKQKSTEFELRVVPEAQGSYRLAFAQTLLEKNPALQYQPATAKTRVEVELGGDSLRALADLLLETLRQNGYKPTELSASRREPFHLDEASGVRLGLIFLATKPLSKTSRIEQISQGVRAMATEELYYWYSKCTTGPATERALKALRVLLAEE